MALAPGVRLGPYEVSALIGEGGMGKVWRARHTALRRDDALKVLPDAFATDPDRLARFQREAQVLASLNHPNIAHVYGLEQTDSVQALVMELVEGPTLADRLAQGAIPVDEALPIAKQIAEALEAAHEQGVVHRDLKPSNIKVRPDGTVKVLDFGLAKALDSTSAAIDATQAPTITSPAMMTGVGVLLGTAAYMSPEQAAGKPVDKRADIWAFGTVLWEMLTGDRLFEGETITHTLASVLTKEPDWTRVPEHARRLLQWCLEKDPKQRLRDIGDAKRLLVHDRLFEAAPVHTFKSHVAWKIAAGVLTALAMPALVISLAHLREQPPQSQILQYTISPPETGRIDSFAVSPDGRYVAITMFGVRSSPLWVRALDSVQPRALPGTENATYPFWSPDSRYIGFFAQGKLKKIALTGGPAQTLGDAPSARGGTWNRDGVIVFSPAGAGLNRISSSGSDPVAITEPGSGSHMFPEFLPDGRRFLYLAYPGKESGIYLGSVDSKESRRLQMDISNPNYLPPAADRQSGHLLFVRGQSLMAQPLDPVSLNATGEPFPVVGEVSRGRRTGDPYSLYSISGDDVLIYQTGAEGAGYQHVWFDRTGKQLGSIGDRARSRRFALSPDGTRVVVERSNDQFISSDLWLSDLEHNTDSRLTVDASVNSFPIWSPDGSRVMFNSTRSGGIPNLYWRVPNSATPDALVLESQEPKFPFDWSRDGKFVVFVNQSPTTLLDIWALPLQPGNTTSTVEAAKPIPLVRSSFQDWMGQLSPDGRWLAYLSDESGRAEVYVQRFAPEDAAAGKPTAGKWQVSPTGGAQPRWRSDGKELFYVAPDRKLMSVGVKAIGEAFERSSPQPLFELRANLAASGLYIYRYAPAPDGSRFLVSTDPEGSTEAPPLNVIVNWLAAARN